MFFADAAMLFKIIWFNLNLEILDIAVIIVFNIVLLLFVGWIVGGFATGVGVFKFIPSIKKILNNIY